MLAGVIKIDDLDRTGKMELRQIPNPFGSVAHDNFLFGATPAALPSLQVKPFPKLLGGFDGPGVGGGIRIANGEALLIPGSLGEYASQLGFARVRRLPIRLALASRGLLLHHRHSGAIHLHV